MKQQSLFEEKQYNTVERKTREQVFNDYEGFVEKFNPKLTTDDCYTPAPVYDAVLAYVKRKYDIPKEAVIMRPFRPGGDYKSEHYPKGCVVVDNPPFSIITNITRWYQAQGISFFLFAPHLTLFGSLNNNDGVTALPMNVGVTYENGAVVATSFITNMSPEWMVVGDPELHKAVDEANRRNQKEAKQNKQLPKYTYPDNVVTSALIGKYVGGGVPLNIRASDCTFIRNLDTQSNSKKRIFGGGLLLSDRAAADRAAADRAAAERAAAERAAAIVWQLSEREREIVRSLG